MRSAVKGLYIGGRACWAQGEREHMFDLHSGVTQGCPLSVWLFCAAFEPYFRWLVETLAPRRGLARACADDVGAVA